MELLDELGNVATPLFTAGLEEFDFLGYSDFFSPEGSEVQR